jgi:hypothetical protein
MTDDKGLIKRDGWIVTWDHSGPGQLLWECRDEDEPHFVFVCRRDDGWRIAPKGFGTVDHEVMLANLAETTLAPEEGWIELLAILESVA